MGVGLACLPAVSRAQVLAQKNWAGSGVSVEVWWKRAVFYRIDPTKFQDSTGSGKGDLAGIAQRLDYLQALGVDAVIVETAPPGGKATLLPTAEVSLAFDTLVREAVGRHVRVLVDLGAPASQQSDAQYVQMARAWLNQGAAGVFVPTPSLEKIDGGAHIALLLQQLRALTNSFPGERVLLADAAAQTQDTMLLNGLAKYAQLTASAPLGAASAGSAAPTVAALRQEWMASMGDTRDGEASVSAESSTATQPARGHRERREGTSRAQVGNNPLLVAVRVPAFPDPVRRVAMERALAVMLLASRSAVLLEYGQELGLEMAGANRPLMQWTPTNVTSKAAAPTDAQAAASAAGYKAFQPYVRPLPKNLFPPPVMPVVEEADLPTPEKIAAMPGFTGGELDAAMVAPNGASASVVTETYDPRSLLNLYKQLIRLHHDNATVRSGAQTVLNRDDVGALVWVRHAPANSRTSTTVVAACNLSDSPVVLTDLSGVTLRAMRSLLQPAPVDLMKLEPGAVVVGETR
ncbi:MAG TPA: hypothetical protein VK814_12975 [Acidobacteriaceae bacterium]|nr:hypothetical protein [Acidobacteriaceae bacterium]